MSVTLTSCKLYANLTAGWTDISADAVGSISANWGISGTTPLDRMADTGTMQFVLRNDDGAYTPGGASVRAGWQKGIGIKLEMVYDGETYIRFKGVLDGIEFEPMPTPHEPVTCTVVDWMNYAAEQQIQTPALQVNKRADEAIDLILDVMPIKPGDKSLEAGISTFPSVFDFVYGAMRKKTFAYSDMAKLIDSELGYLYLTKDKGSGEKLVFENAWHRTGLLPVSTIAMVGADYLLLETGDKILKEDGGKIYINRTETYTFPDGMLALEVQHGDNTANRVSATTYPRKVDAAPVVLYLIGTPKRIGNGELLTFTAYYADPEGGRTVGGLNMVVPVATTDYTVNTLADGSGTDLTTDAIVTVTFGGNSAQVSFKNTSTSSGYITTFQLRGYGVYTYTDMTYVVEDENSINDFGYFERNFDQKYQGGLITGETIAKTNLYMDRYPRNQLKAVRFVATKDSHHLESFLQHDIGSLIQITETGLGMTGAYIIQNISFEVQTLGIIWVTYGLVEHWSLLTDTMTSLDMEFYITDKRGAINYGYLPQVVQTADRSWAAWVYDDGGSYGTNGNGIIAGPFADGGGIYIEVSSNHRVVVYTNKFDVAPGQWNSPTDSLPAAGWHLVVVTLDTEDTAANPVVYIDGASQAVTESLTPDGALNSEYGAEVVVGNWHTDTHDYTATWHGHLKDVRIYNDILTQAEVTALYNAGVCDPLLVTDGLVFQSTVVRSNDIVLYDGIYLWEKLQVLDNIYRAVGTPFGISLATAI